jgi:hypothetical protein
MEFPPDAEDTLDNFGINNEEAASGEEVPTDEDSMLEEEQDCDNEDNEDEDYDDPEYYADIDPEPEASEEPEFRLLIKDTDGKPQLCGYCFDLVVHLQKRVPRRSINWKAIPQLLFKGAFRSCELCELVASAPAVYLDDHDLENKYPLKPLKEYEDLFTDFLDMAIPELTPNPSPIEVFGHVNVVERICEVSFSFNFHERPAQIVLAVWLGMLVIDSGAIRPG